MPVPLWTASSKAEAKYNVITEFPKLGLHAAAASGNVGLVEYALEHGQPINSVLDGVLPIHAASAGGHPQVVKKLIEHGADVNAPRLSRRYFNDKNRDTSAPIVGTSGSTPLHFAAANGNTDVVTLLLLHGAHPDRTDKYGVTPEQLARENNWIECAQILHDWVLNKDRDLREREAISTRDGNGAASTSRSAPRISTSPEPESPSFRRRLHVKHSIDTALNILKVDALSKPHPSVSMGSPPSSPMRPFGDHSFDPDANGNDDPTDSGLCRPSLPQTLPLQPVEEGGRKKVMAPTKLRRPRSAGTGAEGSTEHELVYHPYGRGGSARKLGSKISLLNLFKKGQNGDTSEAGTSSHGCGLTPTKPSASASSTALPLTPNTPLAHTQSNPASALDSPDVHDQGRSRPHAMSDPCAKGSKITPQSKFHLRPSASFLDFDSSAPPSPGQVRPPLPSAVDLHNALAHQQGRDRSRSNATNGTISTSSEFDSGSEEENTVPLNKPDKPEEPFRLRSNPSFKPASGLGSASGSKSSLLPTAEEGEKGAYPSGILRGHHRTASSSQSSPARALRFDSTSTPDRTRKEAFTNSNSSLGPLPPLNTSSSSQSLRSNHDVSQGRVSLRAEGDKPLAEDSPPIETMTEETTQSDHHPQPIDDEREVEGQQRHPLQPKPKQARESQSSLSPIFTNDSSTIQTLEAVKSDFPFSIYHPPPLEDERLPSMDNQLQIPDKDRRGRGDSVSSTWTADSSNIPQYSTSGSTIGSSPSPILSTPGVESSLTLPTIRKELDEEETYEHLVRPDDVAAGDNRHAKVYDFRIDARNTLNERRDHAPLDLNIGAISNHGVPSHAEVRALVEKTKQAVLDVAGDGERSADLNTGPTPLSASLAAYGESLALQRKLKEKEHAQMIAQLTPTTPTSPTRRHHEGLMSAPPGDFNRPVERQLSLDKSGRSRSKVKSKDPRRPSTADGLSTRPGNNSFFPGEHIRTHQTSLSVSPPNMGDATSFDRRDFLSPHQRFPTSTMPSMSTLPTVLEPRASPINPCEREEMESITRISTSDESVDTEKKMASPSTVVRHGASAPALPRSSAKKLNRMGFSVVDQAARPAPPSSGKLLEGFKSIMQTLKGKS